jgi:glycosyltransferase involved in cell wall biosynthesis
MLLPTTKKRNDGQGEIFDSPMTEQCTFSVVIPVHNRAQLLLRAVQSVFAQSFRAYEIIVVDDGSSDDVEGALSAFNDSRLKLVRQENGGASHARNTGIDLARGTYVALLDSDDVFLPDHLANMKKLLDGAGERAVAYCQVIADRGGGRSFIKPPRAIRDGENMATYLMCDRGFVQTSGLCLPTEIARTVRYREDAKFGDDTDFAVRLQLAGCRFVMAPQPSAVWADDLDHERLSNQRLPLSNLKWLEDLRPNIPDRAYHGYRGWHLAKSILHDRPTMALRLFLSAFLRGCYGPRLALVIFLQIVLPNKQYRQLTDFWLRRRKKIDTLHEAF